MAFLTKNFINFSFSSNFRDQILMQNNANVFIFSSMFRMYSYGKSLFTYCTNFAPETETLIIQKSNKRFQIQLKNKLGSYFCQSLVL